RMRKDFLHVSGNILEERVRDMMEEEMRQLVEGHTAHRRSEDWNTEEITEQARAMNVSVDPDDTVGAGGLHEELLVIKDSANLDEEKRAKIEEILQRRADDALSGKVAQTGENATNIFRYFMLQAIDYLWTDHLEIMDYTRSSVRLRAYGQRDPLVEYKNEALKLFRQFNAAVSHLIVTNILKFNVSAAEQTQRAPQQKNLVFSKPSMTGATAVGGSSAALSTIRSSHGQKFKNIGRNDPCPCGAKKVDGTPVKFKHCHGR
ncbi:MAG: preprotein translocase subunit SecA, partial [Parcubacteria group bacterium Gr01-1014_29]